MHFKYWLLFQLFTNFAPSTVTTKSKFQLDDKQKINDQVAGQFAPQTYAAVAELAWHLGSSALSWLDSQLN